MVKLAVVGQTAAGERNNVVVEVDEAVEVVQATVAGRRGGVVGAQERPERKVMEKGVVGAQDEGKDKVVEKDKVVMQEDEVVVEKGRRSAFSRHAPPSLRTTWRSTVRTAEQLRRHGLLLPSGSS